jgi:signal transduction histidine kinase
VDDVLGLLHVLIVEDHPAHSRLLREVLADEHLARYRVSAVTSLDGALAEVARQSFDAIVLDLGLPDATGLDVLRTLRERAPDLPIVVLSGQDDVDFALSALRLGAQDSLVRSTLEGGALHRAIRHAIERKRVQDFERLVIGVVGHDLRNTLHAIQLSCAGLLRRPRPEQEQALVGRACRAVDRATALVGDLLDATNLRLGGPLSIRPAPLDLRTLVERVVAEHRTAYPDRTIRHVAGGGVPIEADAERMAQVASHLVRNALQHSPADTPIEVEVDSRDGTAWLSVANAGPPMPEPLRSGLFDPRQRAGLYQAGLTRSIGVGLYVVHEIVRAHGGEVEVHSSAGEGTRVRVTLARAAAAANGESHDAGRTTEAS